MNAQQPTTMTADAAFALVAALGFDVAVSSVIDEKGATSWMAWLGRPELEGHIAETSGFPAPAEAILAALNLSTAKQGKAPRAESVQRLAKFGPKVMNLVELLGITPELAANQGLATRVAIVNQLEAALKTEIKRGESGDYLYSLPRLHNLRDALKEELEALAPLQAKSPHSG